MTAVDLVRRDARGAPRDATDTVACSSSLLPHELAWGAFLALVWVRVAAAQGAFGRVSLLWLALAGATAVAVLAARRRASLAAWRARLLAFLVVMNAAYFLMGDVVAAVGGGRHDALLQRADRALFGAPLPLYLDAVGAHPLLVDLLSACYFALFPYILVSCVRYAIRARAELATAQAFYAGLFTVDALGFLGYLFVPAQGAYLDIPGAFHHALEGGWIARLNDAVVHRGTNRVDVFPSLHVAASAFMLFFDRRHAPWRYRLYLLPALGLWVSTIALRYHYGVDVIAGFALAGIGMLVAESQLRKQAAGSSKQ